MYLIAQKTRPSKVIGRCSENDFKNNEITHVKVNILTEI